MDRGHHPAQVGQQAHERAAVLAEAVADRHLRVAVALAQQVERQHLGVVEVVDDLGVRGGGARQGAVAALAVGDARPGGERQQPREHQVAGAAVGAHVLDAAGEARADHVVGLAGEDRRHHLPQLLGRVLAVGVAERHRRGAARDGLGEPAPHGRAQAAVGAHGHHLGARPTPPGRRSRRASRRRPPARAPRARPPRRGPAPRPRRPWPPRRGPAAPAPPGPAARAPGPAAAAGRRGRRKRPSSPGAGWKAPTAPATRA